MTGVDRVYNALLSGEALTAKQITARYGLANPRDAVYSIRQNGYAVALVEHVDTKGRVKRKYTLDSTVPSVTSYTVKGIGV
jgi:hypothetical protein